jgi:competence protein ComEC
VSAVAAGTARLRLGLEAVRAHPRHLALAALIGGLVAGPRGPLAALGVGAVAALVAGRGGLVLLAAAAALLGAQVAVARTAALEHTALGPLLGRDVGVRAVVLEPARTSAYDSWALAELGTGPGRGERVMLTAPRRLRWPADAVGAQVAVRGRLGRLKPWEGFAAARGAHAELAAAGLRATGRRRGGVAGVIDSARRRAEGALTRDLPAREGALLRGMVLGQDQALPAAVRDDFRASGLGHIVAASGQNVALLAALALPVLALAGLPLRARLLVLLALIAMYVPLAGGGASIQRAGVMGAAAVVAALAGAPRSRWYALGLAVVVTLVMSPPAVFDVGWQLSFAAVTGILALGPRLAAGLERRSWPPRVAQALALTAAATLATTPLLATHFGRLSLVSLPVNLLAAPVVAAVMWIGMLAAAVGQVAASAGAALALPAAPGLGFLEVLARAAARVPHATAQVPAASLWFVPAAYAGIAALVLAPRVRRPAVLVAAPAVAAALAWPARSAAPPIPPGGARIEFLDIGQGDATLIQAGGHAVLVDAGPPGGPVLARLRTAGVDHLDVAVVTHDQDDHEGGMPAVLRVHHVGLLLDGATGARTALHRRLLAAAHAGGARALAPDAGQVLTAGPIRVQVVWPAAEPAALHRGEDPNLRAVVARVTVSGASLLLTADAESDVTAPLDLEPVDLLKVAHHGSDDPGLPDELRTLQPRVAVVEVGRHNTYGHPTAGTLAALRSVPAVRRTDRDGTVTVTVDHGRLSLSSARGGGGAT